MRLSFKNQLILISVMSVIGGVALLVFGIFQQLHSGKAQAEARLRAETATIVRDVLDSLALYQQILGHAAARSGAMTIESGRCDPGLVVLRDAIPGLRNLGVMNTDGRLLCSLVAMPQSGVSLARAPWFAPALGANGPAVGGAFRSPVLDAWVSILTYPIRNSRGEQVGLAALPVGLDQFGYLLERLVENGPDAAGIVDAQGALIALSSGSLDGVGKPLSDPGLRQALLSAQADAVTEYADGQGVRRTVSVATVPDSGWKVFVEIPTSAVFDEVWEQGRLRVFFLLSLMMLVFPALAMIVAALLRPMDALAETAQRVSQGYSHLRAEVVGPTEVRAIATQFNRLLDQQAASAASLRESEERYKAMVEHSPDAIVVFDAATGVFEDVNPQAERLFGRPRQQLLQLDWAALSPPRQPDGRSSAEAARHWIAQAMGGGQPEFEWLHRDASGVNVPCEVKLLAMPGPRALVRGSISDLSGRRRLEQDLQARLAAINAAPSAIAFADPQGVLTFANPAYARMWGYSLDQVVGRPAQHFLASKGEANAAIEALRRDGRWFGELAGLRADGSGMLLEITASMIRDAEDQPLCMMGVFVDITARKAAEQRILELNQELERRVAERTEDLAAANRELEAFSYSVSHDLRSPLRAIDGYSAIVMEQEKDRLSDDALDLLQRSRKASQRMAKMIDDLLGLAKISRSELNRSEVDCTAIVRQLAAELAGREPARHCRWEIAEGVRANADPGLIGIILQNLLENAWRYTSKRPDARIEFGMRQDPGEGRIYYVSDNGAGFEQAYADKLFGAFQRLHSEQQFPGHGIGLATVRRAVARHGGLVWARGVVGEGAEFSFSLGVANKPDRAPGLD